MSGPLLQHILFVVLALSGAQDAAGSVALLESADIRIRLEGQRAHVSALYEFDRPSGLLLLEAMRMPGQSLELEAESSPGTAARREDLEGLYRLMVRTAEGPDADASARVELRLRYRIEGDLSRIPLFVPTAPAIPRESPISITLSGEPVADISGDVFPRFERGSDGSLIAQPTHLPSLVLLPWSSRSFSVNRVAEWSVIILILIASAYWLTRVRPTLRAAPGQRRGRGRGQERRRGRGQERGQGRGQGSA